MLKDIIRKTGIILTTSVVCVVCAAQVIPAVPSALKAILHFTADSAMRKAEYIPEDERPNETNEEELTSSQQDISDNNEQPSVGSLQETVEDGIITKQLDATTANTSYEGIYLNNKTSVDLNIGDILSLEGSAALENTDKPQVLIVHTHTSESYADGSGTTRNTDGQKGVVRVGREMCDVLNAAGINTLHDETLHDYPSYTGSYSRTADTINKYLNQYPTIKFVIDIHRDSIGSEGAKVKPTVEINGKKAAQIMFVTGCETGEVTDFPNWKYNLQTALKLQRQIESDHPGLTRSIYFTDCRYNMNLTKGSMLIEVGTDANTLEEAVYSAKLAAESIAEALLNN